EGRCRGRFPRRLERSPGRHGAAVREDGFSRSAGDRPVRGSAFLHEPQGLRYPSGVPYTLVMVAGRRYVYHQNFYSLRRTLVIEVQHVTKRYGRVTAVDDVSFRVEPGEILGFLGPNGAGKTTTMRILTGYMPASEGRATVAGYDVFTHPLEAKRRTGYLPETPPLYPDMTVRQYLDLLARIKGIAAGERASRLVAVMKRTHIDDVASRHCGKLSKGYRQRVGLAQSILHNPEVLILDEPTAGLDPKQIIETRDLIRSLAGDHTIVLSTHILPEVSQT